MSHLLRLLPFLGFLILGLRLATCSEPSRREQARAAFLAYTLSVSLIAGLTHREIWPFSSFRIFAKYNPPGAVRTRLVLNAVDMREVECEIDVRFSSPMIGPSLEGWLEGPFERLAQPARDQAFAFLLAKAESSLSNPPPASGVARAVAAPVHFALYTLGPPRGPVCAPPLRALRLYRESWRSEERFVDPGSFERVLLHEFRER